MDQVQHFPDEEEHLRKIEAVLSEELGRNELAVKDASLRFEEAQKEHQDNYYDMDTRERLAMDGMLNSLNQNIAGLEKTRDHLMKLQDSPYFARIDFQEKGEDRASSYYLGRFGYSKDRKLLIYDWRAPVSSMFYDHDTGPAWYDAPMGRIEGDMPLKRQFRIRKGELDYVVDNSQTVSDDVLQEELSRASDDRMKTIIATIQKEQNVVIRNEKAAAMVIQGAAGSGKTSIALHRIAFLLYRFRDSLKAQDVVILSPSKAFSDFISNVIPELGEEPIHETDFYDIAADQLDRVLDFEDPEDPLDNADPGFEARVRYKSSAEFLEQLKEYAEILPERIFDAADFVYDGTVIEAEWIREQFLFYKNDPIKERIPVIAEEIVEELLTRRGRHRDLPKVGPVKNRIRSMLTIKSAAALYRDFYYYIGRPDMLFLKKNRLEWADVYPFLYLWHRYQGLPRDRRVKHLIVDEMQDYTPVQYEVLNILYPCNKTILGDFSQNVNPFNACRMEDILGRFKDPLFVELKKSYRSTKEIMTFAASISPQTGIEFLDRHGDVPACRGFSTEEEELFFILSRLAVFRREGGNTFGIILKSRKKAEAFYEKLSKHFPDASLLTSESNTFGGGILITSVQVSKGLEFDEVLIPEVTEETYQTPHDRTLLYIACTRAMHRLTLTFSGARSPLIP